MSRERGEGAIVFGPRVGNLVAVIAVVAALDGALTTAAAASIPSAQVSAEVTSGTVDLAVSPDADGISSDYTVNFVGPIADHGWRHTGTLSGVGSTWRFASMGSTPILSMTSDDGTISGNCVGSSDTASDVTTTAFHMRFGCVLSRSGGTPWQISLNSALAQGAGSVWTGSYEENDLATPQVNVDGALTYGEVQLGGVSNYGVDRVGPLRFSGQMDIGGTLYRGDLVSGISDPVYSSDVPPLAVSGSSNGVDVSGTCSGAFDQVLGSYEFNCSLAVGSAAPVNVSLKAVFATGFSGCSFRDCWGDSAGYYIAG